MDQNHLYVEPASMIESLCKVNLEDDAFHTFYFDRVNGFLCSSYGLMDLSILKERKLLWIDMVGEYGMKPIHNDLNDDFVKGIAERDWLKVIKG